MGSASSSLVSAARAATRTEAFIAEVLDVVEIDADDRIAAVVVFDLDDFDAAIAELDARYLAGEAAAHARTWSVDRGELRGDQPTRTPRDHAGLCEHRPPTGDRDRARRPDRIHPRRVGPGPDIKAYVETVHRLTDLGAVVTHAAHETSQEGFDAEWRGIAVLDGRRRHGQPQRGIRRGRPRRRHREVRSAQPAGTAAGKRGKPSVRAHLAYFAARDWDAMAEIAGRRLLQRRSPSGGGCRESDMVETPRSQTCGRSPTCRTHERDVDRHCDPRASASSSCVSLLGPRSRARGIPTEVLSIVEIDADERIVASSSFDLDDIDAAFEELDARYLAGEAAAYSHTWSVIDGCFRRDQPARTTRD